MSVVKVDMNPHALPLNLASLLGLAWGTKVFQDLHVLCLAIALVRHYKRPKIVTDAKPHITKMRPDLITVLALLETESYNHHEESPDQH